MNNITTYGTTSNFTVGNNPYFQGNSFSSPILPKYVPSINIISEIKPYGFIGFPKEGTSVFIFNNNILGYYDNRIPFGIEDLKEDECAIYSNDQILLMQNGKQVQKNQGNTVTLDNENYTANIKNNVTVTAQNELINKVNESMLELNTALAELVNGWGIACTPNGLSVITGGNSNDLAQGDQDNLPLYTPLARFLNAVVAHINNLTSTYNSHTHANNGGAPPNPQFSEQPYFKNGEATNDINNMRSSNG